MDTMYILGVYVFGLDTAAPQEITRDTRYSWAAHDIFGGAQSLQFTGWGDETITLQGVIYTEFIGNTNQLTAMRATADLGEPMQLIDGRGNILGDWVITSISERQDVFAAAGTPLRQHFNMSLQRYGGIEYVTNAGGYTTSMLERLRADAQSQDGLLGLLGWLDSGIQAGGMGVGVLGDAISAISSVTGDVQGILSTAQRAMSAAQSLKSAAGGIKSAVQAIKNADDLGSLAGAISSGIANINSASNTAAQAGKVLIDMASSAPAQITSVVSAAGYASNQVASAAAKVSQGVQDKVRGWFND